MDHPKEGLKPTIEVVEWVKRAKIDPETPISDKENSFEKKIMQSEKMRINEPNKNTHIIEELNTDDASIIDSTEKVTSVCRIKNIDEETNCDSEQCFAEVVKEQPVSPVIEIISNTSEENTDEESTKFDEFPITNVSEEEPISPFIDSASDQSDNSYKYISKSTEENEEADVLKQKSATKTHGETMEYTQVTPISEFVPKLPKCEEYNNPVDILEEVGSIIQWLNFTELYNDLSAYPNLTSFLEVMKSFCQKYMKHFEKCIYEEMD
ncbi:hypothetical protein ACTXT7_011294 [Hymenolepis weldensis]